MIISTQHDQISLAAKMAGEWWAQRLHSDHADKRDAFGAAVAKWTEAALRGTHFWEWGTAEPQPGSGVPQESVYVESDYDPKGLLLTAVREAVDPECRGMGFSSLGILPTKTSLRVLPTKLKPKEGYGNWTDDIPVPEVAAP